MCSLLMDTQNPGTIIFCFLARQLHIILCNGIIINVKVCLQ